MIPLLIRWTLGCNYQSWGPRKTRGAAGDDGFLSFPLYLALYLPPLSLSLSLSLLLARSSGLSLNVGVELIVIRRPDQPSARSIPPRARFRSLFVV